MVISTATKTRTLLTRLFDTSKPTRPIISFRPQKPVFPTENIPLFFKREVPEERGISSSLILDFLKKLNEDYTLNMHSILILRGDSVICEAEFGSNRMSVPKYTFSACKSITTLAIGMLAGEGLLSLDEKLVDIFSEDLSAINKLKFSDLTVRRLLTMQSGVLFNEAECMTEKAWIESFFDSVSYTSAKTFNYNSLNTYMLAAIVKAKTGLGLSEYLQPRLFAPLSITDYFWERCPKGIEKGGWGLYIRPEDLAKIGLLVMNGGVWEGQQLVPAEYIKEATSVHVQTPEEYGEYDYGYQIWVHSRKDIFLFNGMLGQNVMCFRENGIIVVSFAGNDEAFQQSNYFKYVHEAFSGQFPEKLERSKDAEKELISYIPKLKAGKPPVYPVMNRLLPDKHFPKGCDKLDGRCFTVSGACLGLMPLTYQAIQNNYSAGISKLDFSIEYDRLYLNIEEGTDRHHIPLSFDKPVNSYLTFHGESFYTSAQAWLARNEYENVVLTVRLDFLETPCTRYMKFVFSKECIELVFDERPGKRYILDSIDEYGSSLPVKVLIGAALGNSDLDFLKFKVERAFSPHAKLTELNTDYQ